jgi:hypothetical protein
VDRVTVRSFRAPDLAERAIKDLVRSRRDTGREVAFRPIGTRFLEARDDPARIVALLREDAFHAEKGHFARLSLRLHPQLADRLARLEPRVVERKLEDAARDATLRELPRAQGLYVVRFEPSARGGLEPVAHVHLTARNADGGPASALTREDARRIETAWDRGLAKAFGLERLRESEPQRAPDPRIEGLRQEWARASARLFAAYTDRLHGKATAKQLADALTAARETRGAWSQAAGPRVDLRDVERRQVFDSVRVRIEGGARYLAGPLAAHRRPILEAAAARAVGVPENDRRLAVVAWPVGQELRATVYFNQRSAVERSQSSLDPELVRAAMEERLRDEIRRLAAGLDPREAARAEALGRVEARLPEPEPLRQKTALERPDVPEPAPSPAMVVTLDADRMRDAEAVGRSAQGDQAAMERLQRPERDWSQDRVVAVRLRVPTGAEQLEKLGLNREETTRVVQRAVDRAYPFLEQEGLRDSFRYSVHGRALDVQVIVPEKLGWTPEQLRSPQFQQRFITGFHQALAQVGPTRTGPAQQRMLPGFARDVATIRQVPQVLRQMEQEPERAARDLAKAVFNKLSEALPKPFRLARDLGRTIGRLIPRGE